MVVVVILSLLLDANETGLMCVSKTPSCLWPFLLLCLRKILWLIPGKYPSCCTHYLHGNLHLQANADIWRIAGYFFLEVEAIGDWARPAFNLDGADWCFKLFVFFKSFLLLFACSKLQCVHGCQGIAIRLPAYKLVLNLFFSSFFFFFLQR